MFLFFQPPPSLPKMYEGLSSTVAFDRSSGIAALCTENYCVQLYNLLNDRGISEVLIFFSTLSVHKLSLSWYAIVVIVNQCFCRFKFVRETINQAMKSQ